MSTLLSERIRTLRLRADAPYPSEVRDGHDMVLQWRKRQRMHLVDFRDIVTDDFIPDADDGEIER